MKPVGALWWCVFVVTQAVGLFGDVSMKRAGATIRVDWIWFAVGFAAYATTGVGWLVLLRTQCLAVFGVLYPLANAIGLVLIGALGFHEHVGARGWFGLGLGLLAIGLLGGDRP